MLRAVVVIFGIGLLGLGAWLASVTGEIFPSVMPLLFGLVVLAGTLFERYRYRKIESDRPGLGWVETGERFIDPETKEAVTVFQRPATGERRYVRGR